MAVTALFLAGCGGLRPLPDPPGWERGCRDFLGDELKTSVLRAHSGAGRPVISVFATSIASEQAVVFFSDGGVIAFAGPGSACCGLYAGRASIGEVIRLRDELASLLPRLHRMTAVDAPVVKIEVVMPDGSQRTGKFSVLVAPPYVVEVWDRMHRVAGTTRHLWGLPFNVEPPPSGQCVAGG